MDRISVCHVCFATDRQNTPIFGMSAKIDCQLRQVCSSVFLSARNTWATKGRNFVKCNIYIYVRRLFEILSKFQARLNYEKKASSLHENVQSVQLW